MGLVGAVRYSVVSSRSTVSIKARSSVHPINAETSGLKGFFEADMLADGTVDLTGTPKGRIELAVGLLRSGNPLNDREMRRRVDSRRFPTISGELTGMRATKTVGRYVVSGQVTCKGATREAEDEMTIAALDDRTLLLEGEHTFDFTEFGIVAPKIMMLRVYPEVVVAVRIVAEADS
jgi:hypothetical protein